MAIGDAVINSKREFSFSPVSARTYTANTSTGGLTHRKGTKPMITIPFSYHVGGALPWNDATYIKRQADSELFSAIQQGKFAYVLGARQIGKSSLRIQTRHQLIQQGYRCVTIQASQLRHPSQPIDTLNTPIGHHHPDQGCSAFISALWADLNLSKTAHLRTWLKATTGLSVPARLACFSNDVLMGELCKTPIVVFIDEIDALLGSPFLADLLDWIAQCDRRRTTEVTYKNLHFVVLGTATTSDLSQTNLEHTSASLTGTHHTGLDHATQPQPIILSQAIIDLFANGCNIALAPFTLIETFALHQGFEEKIDNPTILMKAIFKWAQGQPFLTQKLCRIASSLINTLVQPSSQPIVISTSTVNRWIDHLVRSHLIEDWATQDDPIHFKAIRDRLVYSPHSKALLTLYKTIYAGTPVPNNNSSLQAELLLTGLISTLDNRLQIANPIYREIFAVTPSPTQLPTKSAVSSF